MKCRDCYRYISSGSLVRSDERARLMEMVNTKITTVLPRDVSFFDERQEDESKSRVSTNVFSFFFKKLLKYWIRVNLLLIINFFLCNKYFYSFVNHFKTNNIFF